MLPALVVMASTSGHVCVKVGQDLHDAGVLDDLCTQTRQSIVNIHSPFLKLT